MMQGMDYVTIAQQRRTNYMLMQEALGDSNHFNLPLENDAVPMVYPNLVDVLDLRENL